MRFLQFTSPVFLLLGAQVVSAHYIWNKFFYGDGLSLSSTAVIRQPFGIDPVEDVLSVDMRCNLSPKPAMEIISVEAGSRVGFGLDLVIYHPGPAAIYLGKSPVNVTEWDGNGEHWFKIIEWGAHFDPEFNYFDVTNLRNLTAIIPPNTPPGEYLIRIEQLGLTVPGNPQWYISCAQINVTGGGSGTPAPTVAIPGYVQPDDPGVTINIYDPIPTAYTVPGPAVWFE